MVQPAAGRMVAAEAHMNRLEQRYHGILHDLRYGMARRGPDQRCVHHVEALADMVDCIADSSRLRQEGLLGTEPLEAARMGRSYRLDEL